MRVNLRLLGHPNLDEGKRYMKLPSGMLYEVPVNAQGYRPFAMSFDGELLEIAVLYNAPPIGFEEVTKPV